MRVRDLNTDNAEGSVPMEGDAWAEWILEGDRSVVIVTIPDAELSS